MINSELRYAYSENYSIKCEIACHSTRICSSIQTEAGKNPFMSPPHVKNRLPLGGLVLTVDLERLVVLDDLRGGGEERLVGAPAHQRVAVVRGRRGVPHEGGRHVPAARDARVERLKWMDKLLETNTDVHAYNDTLGDQTRVSL